MPVCRPASLAKKVRLLGDQDISRNRGLIELVDVIREGNQVP